MTAIEAARNIKKYVSPSVCRKLPRVALVEAIRAVQKGTCPRAVAEAIAEAA